MENHERHGVSNNRPLDCLFFQQLVQVNVKEMTYPFSNLNGSNVEVWEWVICFIQHLKMDVIAYPSWISIDLCY